LNDGRTCAWGVNSEGQLGDGSVTQRNFPVLTTYADDFTGIENIFGMSQGVGAVKQSIIIKPDGTIWAAGEVSNGKLGTNLYAINWTRYREIQPATLKNDTPQIRMKQSGTANLNITYSPGFNIFSLQKTIGTLTYWSLDPSIATVNSSGLIFGVSTGSTNIKVTDKTNNITIYVPVEVTRSGANQITNPQIDNPYNATTVLKSDGTVWAWGTNANGQLGDGTTVTRLTPVQVAAPVNAPAGYGPYLKDIVQISSGAASTTALDKNGNVYAWGLQTGGRLGNNQQGAANISTPVQVLTGDQMSGSGFLEDIVQIAAGENFTLALDKNGQVWSWGTNGSAQLGVNNTTNYGAPKRVIGLSNIKEIAAEHASGLALDNTGRLYGWGRNDFGQLRRWKYCAKSSACCYIRFKQHINKRRCKYTNWNTPITGAERRWNVLGSRI